MTDLMNALNVKDGLIMCCKGVVHVCIMAGSLQLKVM